MYIYKIYIYRIYTYRIYIYRERVKFYKITSSLDKLNHQPSQSKFRTKSTLRIIKSGLKLPY